MRIDLSNGVYATLEGVKIAPKASFYGLTSKQKMEIIKRCQEVSRDLLAATTTHVIAKPNMPIRVMAASENDAKRYIENPVRCPKCFNEDVYVSTVSFGDGNENVKITPSPLQLDGFEIKSLDAEVGVQEWPMSTYDEVVECPMCKHKGGIQDFGGYTEFVGEIFVEIWEGSHSRSYRDFYNFENAKVAIQELSSVEGKE